MNKKDLLPVIILALMIPVWILFDKAVLAPKFPVKHPAPPTAEEQQLENVPETAAPAEPAPSEAVPVPEKTVLPVAKPAEEEVVQTLENDKLRIDLTSWGGGIKSATLLNYPEQDKKESPPVMLDFSGAAALSYEGLAGAGTNDAFAVQTSEDGQSVTFSRKIASGLVFERTISFERDYLLKINDRLTNPGSEPLSIEGFRILTGRMQNPADTKAMRGISILGVDTHTPDGGVNYWGRKLYKLYGKAKPQPLTIDTVPEEMKGVRVDWVSAKNKFFTQIIRPENPEATMAILSRRDPMEKRVSPEDVTAALVYSQQTLAPGETQELNFSYYIGPKKYSVLKAAGYKMEKVMEFETVGTFSWMNWMMEPARRFLLWTLNKFYAVIPNYGVAIILLTVLVRVLFWPLTHKSTESMKRMQELQPEIKALQEKYKKEPQRAQQEVMKLYREKKVNPMGGCLPMFVQMPVFFALFTVLRNAIELRYAGFLWIADLSQPENLFAGHVPVVGSLNILPVLMTISMIFQSKLTTPSTAVTPEQQQQQKTMMYMMPIMMLFIFYKMPSGLTLYWTTSNVLMIAQTSIRNLRKKTKEA